MTPSNARSLASVPTLESTETRILFFSASSNRFWFLFSSSALGYIFFPVRWRRDHVGGRDAVGSFEISRGLGSIFFRWTRRTKTNPDAATIYLCARDEPCPSM